MPSPFFLSKKEILMPEALGTKETKEALVALLAISKFVASRMKDGVGADDGFALIQKLTTDTAFKALIDKAVENYKLIPAEVKDLSFAEALELLAEGAVGVKDIVSELRGV